MWSGCWLIGTWSQANGLSPQCWGWWASPDSVYELRAMRTHLEEELPLTSSTYSELVANLLVELDMPHSGQFCLFPDRLLIIMWNKNCQRQFKAKGFQRLHEDVRAESGWLGPGRQLWSFSPAQVTSSSFQLTLRKPKPGRDTLHIRKMHLGGSLRESPCYIWEDRSPAWEPRVQIHEPRRDTSHSNYHRFSTFENLIGSNSI